jgi:hypothetical protein
VPDVEGKPVRSSGNERFLNLRFLNLRWDEVIYDDNNDG